MLEDVFKFKGNFFYFGCLRFFIFCTCVEVFFFNLIKKSRYISNSNRQESQCIIIHFLSELFILIYKVIVRKFFT